MNILIAGGSGFVGTQLTRHLLSKGHAVSVLDLKPPRIKVAYHIANLTEPLEDPGIVSGYEAVVQLSGAPITQRWSKRVKQMIYDSRVQTTRHLVQALAAAAKKPRTLVCASAVGYYGDRGEELLTEQSPPGDDFLAKLCRDWEAAAKQAEGSGLRVVNVRTAPVLGAGGLLVQMVPIYRWGLGGPLGSGKQWFPWIALEDLAAVYALAVEDDRLQGPVNAAAPGLVRQKEFAKTLGRVLHRPAFFPTPSLAVRALYGELADSVTVSEKVEPRALAALNFAWQFPELAQALKASV